MAAKEGWRGRFFEDFEVGDVYRHPLGRTVTETDNVWFTLLTQNTAPVHFDRHYAAQTEFGRPLVDSTFTVALVLAGALMGGDVARAVYEIREKGIIVLSLNMPGSVPDAADLVVSDPVQCGVMAVMAVSSSARFDIARQRGRRY
jgi:hypothetical protein